MNSGRNYRPARKFFYNDRGWQGPGSNALSKDTHNLEVLGAVRKANAWKKNFLGKFASYPLNASEANHPQNPRPFRVGLIKKDQVFSLNLLKKR